MPNCVSYDPAYAYELAVIIQDGIRRMYHEQESVFYYLTVMNEQYAMPPMPEGAREGILKGMYRFRAAANPKAKLKAQLLGSGAILNEVARGAEAAREVRRRRRRVERHQLPGALSRRPRVRALEHAASRRDAARAVRHAVPEGRTRRPRRGVRLSEGPARLDRSLDAAPDAVARHRRLRPQRGSRARCATSSRSTPRFVALATLAELAQDGQIDARSWRRRSRTSGSIPRSRIRPTS